MFPGACRLAGTSRIGLAALFAGGIQRLGVSPDGSTVVFEKTNRFSVIAVAAAGAGPRRILLGARRRQRLAAARPGEPGVADPIRSRCVSSGRHPNDTLTTSLSFSADGRTIVFTDRGPGPAGEDAAQIVTLDLATGTRRQVTRLPRATPANPPILFPRPPWRGASFLTARSSSTPRQSRRSQPGR